MGKTMKARARGAKMSNEKVIYNSMKVSMVEETLFGRVEKCLGFSCFECITSEGHLVKATLPGKFKRTIFINKDSHVIIERADKIDSIHQIIGVLSQKDASTLFKQGRMPKNVYVSSASPDSKEDDKDDIFDREEEDSDVDIDAV
jgi:translation initiation factor IF-1